MNGVQSKWERDWGGALESPWTYWFPLALRIDNLKTWRGKAREQWNQFKAAVGRRIPSSTVLLLLRLAETILESLSFIPGVAPIVEFKSVLESVAEGSAEAEGAAVAA